MDKAGTGPPRGTDAAQAAERQMAALARRAHLDEVRAAVRMQLAASQKQRLELAQALRERRFRRQS